jgi:hypothetical protein
MKRSKLYKLAICFLMLILCNWHEAAAQDFKQALQSLKRKYERMEKFHLIMFIKAFEDSITTRPYYEQRAEIKREGTNYLYFFGSNEMLMNSKYLIVVDKTARDIVCSQRDVNGETEFFSKDPVQMNLDSILNSNSESYFVGIDEGIDHYKIKMKAGSIKIVDLFIARNDNVLSSIKYTYSEGQCVKISFEKFDTQPAFNENTFNENIYMISAKGKLLPSEAFKRYQLMEVKN